MKIIMEHKAELTFLINTLLNEKESENKTHIPEDEEGMRKLLRALMNKRYPGYLREDFLQIQDKILSEETIQRGIIDVFSIPPSKNNPRISLWQGDITRLKADAIVNAANNRALGCFIAGHNCIDNIIHSAAGLQLREECFEKVKEYKNILPIGKAIITKGYNLPAKFVLHTVGPRLFEQAYENDCIKLASCYNSCLDIAEKYAFESIVFCCISTGEYRFPNQKAAEVAFNSVSEFLNKNKSIKKVVFNVFKDQDLQIYNKYLQD